MAQCQNKHIGELPRTDRFPLRVGEVFYCMNSVFPFTGEERICECMEVCLRLDSEAKICTDLVEGKPMKIPFPHVIFKRPGMKIALDGDKPRDILSFCYHPGEAALLKEWGLLPEEAFWPIRMTESMQRIISEFRHVLSSYTLPGMTDRLDWVALKIIREVLFQRKETVPAVDPASRIQKAQLYLQHHYDRVISCDEVAARFGFSHASFFREWRKQFELSPKEYVLKFRLEAAAQRLSATNLPVSAIVREVHFSGLTAFYRKFMEQFGVTPDEFRSRSNFSNTVKQGKGL